MSTAQKLTALALAQVGTAENGENDVKYNTAYYGREVNGAAYPWCMAFIWWLFREAGASSLFCDGGKSAYCPYVVWWAKEHGRWVTGGYREGDIVFYDWNGDNVADHVGYCVSNNGKTCQTVEGNVSGGVRSMTRTVSSILGAYRPDYQDEPGQKPTEAEPQKDGVWERTRLLKRGDVNGAVLSVQVLLIYKWAIDCGPDGADGEYGPRTEEAVVRFQRSKGIEDDGIVGPVTMNKLIG